MKATEYITNLLEYDGEGLKIDNTPDQNIRYYGANPNNYVSFNNELWRIIGVFGNNVKLVRSEKLGDLSWDSSDSSINKGKGINQWGESTDEDGNFYEGADLKNFLNTMYYGGTSVTCCGERNNQTTTCPTGTIDETSKGLIDNHIWNTGAPNYSTLCDSTLAFYSAERGTKTGKNCTSSDNCNDNIIRTTSWTGYIALPYMTDWAYASSESVCETRMEFRDSGYNYICQNNNWMQRSIYTWYLSPYDYSDDAYDVWSVYGGGRGESHDSAHYANAVFPSIYLKSKVKIESGNGTSSNPYILKLDA